MKYMALIYGEEKARQAMTQEELGAMMSAYTSYTEALQKAGKMVAGDALQDTPAATTIRATSGKTVTTDGPFAETKEQLGGYYIIDANDLDEAIEWASKIPVVAMGGTVEVRPVLEM